MAPNKILSLGAPFFFLKNRAKKLKTVRVKRGAPTLKREG
jgi:hypothetical protein